MAKYRKKPVVIEAALYDGTLVGDPGGTGKVIPKTCPEWFPAAVREVGIGTEIKVGDVAHCCDALLIGTTEGTMRASSGDWIIRGVKGELYPCKPDVFAVSYESA